MAKKPKTNTKALAQARHRRRRLITFVRMCKYGISNFSRNAWLTVAATAVMTITLLIVFVTVASQNILADTATEIARKIDRSIYLKSDTSELQAQPIMNELKGLSNVDAVQFISSAKGKEDLAKINNNDPSIIDAIKLANNKIPATVRINLKDPNDTTQLVAYVKDSALLKEYIDPDRVPSFMSDRKSPADTIAKWTKTAQEVGIGASVVFTAISILIIFNTIRMAIFNRRDEIEMMKLIGAEKSFIRGPFVVEAIVYGIIASFVATALGMFIMYSMRGRVSDWGIVIEPTIDLFVSYAGFVILGMVLVGALVGTISSLLATRRYLRI